MAIKVCLIATDAVSFNVLYRDQLEFLQEAGLELTMICGGSEVELARLRSRQVGRVFDFGLVRSPSPLRDAGSLARLIFHLLVHRYDVVLSTTPKAILLGSIAAWIAGQRNRIVFFQGRVYENFIGFKRRCFAFMDWLSIRLSTRTLFVSPSLRAVFEGEGLLPAGQGEVVGAGSVGGVDTVRFSPDRFDRTEIAALRESLTIPDTHFIALTVGRICVDKGLEELKSLAIELAGENLMFVLVGSVEEGNEVLAGEVFSLANVRYVPFVSEVARYFALADVHLFLSHREGFGNVALEAAACGIPTIAFDVVGVRDSVVDGVSGLRMRFGDIGAVEMAIKEALDDPHAFRARFSGARKWVETIYSSGRVWQSYLALFEEYRRR